ncbi:MAG: PIN domain-containing protein [Candidatus Cloacimonetes bacterium]|nr:PIN domain-containing protein [Candidatus Cloacimonadota bacterium]
MITKYYIDTSVFGGYFDSEFERITKKLFSKIEKEKIIILYSEMTESELLPAPKKVQSFVRGLSFESIEYIEISEEAIQLADKYINEKVVGKTSRDDCIHIALATIHKADVLISWNFKHIVNLCKIRGYNSVNLKLGYSIIEIRSPKEIINYEEE